ncbi:MAG: hypothetical protein NC078_04995 [Ruminococcus sp.]|nr:hypothetical protein [Ruminococcus sp.]
MARVIVRRRPEQGRGQPKKVKPIKFDKGNGGDPERLAELLNEVMGCKNGDRII